MRTFFMKAWMLLLTFLTMLFGTQGKAPAVNPNMEELLSVSSYSGEAYLEINENHPFFEESDYTKTVNISSLKYSTKIMKM